MHVRLSKQTEGTPSERRDVNPEAYRLYLQGRFFLFNQANEHDLNTAVVFFHRALEKDPRYALALVSISTAYLALADYMSPTETMPKAREYALKAIEMRGAPAEAHVALGLVKLLYDWDWLAADREFKYDSPRNPNSVEAFSCYFHYKDALGRNFEAVAELSGLLARDPTSPWVNEELGCASYFARDYEKSILQYHRTIGLQPDLQIAYLVGGRALAQKKLYAEAIGELKKGMKLDPDWPLIVSELGYALGVLGDKAGAQAALQHLSRLRQRRYVDALLVALVYLGLGEQKQAFAFLEKAYNERSATIPWLKVDPKFDVVRSDPRYLDLVRRVGFTY